MRSLYFSVAAMSTAGSSAGHPRRHGLGDDFSAALAAVFCLLGVPLYGVAMGLVANIFVDSLVQARVTLPSDLTDEEFNRVAGLSIDDGTVQFGEFFILELLRQGKVDMDGVHAIKRAYDRIDSNGDGSLSAHEVRRFHKICALRHRYAQYLATEKHMQHDFAIAVVIEMDTQALVQKARPRWSAAGRGAASRVKPPRTPEPAPRGAPPPYLTRHHCEPAAPPAGAGQGHAHGRRLPGVPRASAARRRASSAARRAEAALCAPWTRGWTGGRNAGGSLLGAGGRCPRRRRVPTRPGRRARASAASFLPFARRRERRKSSAPAPGSRRAPARRAVHPAAGGSVLGAGRRAPNA